MSKQMSTQGEGKVRLAYIYIYIFFFFFLHIFLKDNLVFERDWGGSKETI